MQQDFHPDFITRYKEFFWQEEMQEFLRYCQLPLRKAIRINTSRIDEQDFLMRAKKNNWQLTKIPYIDTGYFIDREDKSVPLGKSIEYFAGLFYIQETSSMIPPMVLKPEAWELLLDVSAAPGSKSTQLANMMEESGFVLANDIIASRMKALRTNINYLGHTNIWISKLDGRDFGRYFTETFDKILLDAPCSWEGTMRKETINWNLEVIQELSKLQEKLLLSALQALKVWGTLVYSTCTMTPEENEKVLNAVKQQLWSAIEIVKFSLKDLQSSPWIQWWQWQKYDEEVQNAQKIWPHINDTEWFFVAKIIKYRSLQVYEQKEYYTKKNEEVELKGKQLKALLWNIEKKFWISKEVFIDYILVKKENEIWIRTKKSNIFASYPMMQNAGLVLWSFENNDFQFHFYASRVFWKYVTKQVLQIDEQQSQDFIQWKNIMLSINQQQLVDIWQVIIQFDWLVLWTSSVKNWTLKNQVPREHIKS